MDERMDGWINNCEAYIGIFSFENDFSIITSSSIGIVKLDEITFK